MIAIPLIIQTFFIIGITYFACRPLGIVYEDAALTSQIVASSHFEVAIAVALTLYCRLINSPAGLSRILTGAPDVSPQRLRSSSLIGNDPYACV